MALFPRISKTVLNSLDLLIFPSSESYSRSLSERLFVNFLTYRKEEDQSFVFSLRDFGIIGGRRMEPFG